MPTNSKWLEHTERAAWDTVQSLRREIEKERERMARLAPAGENWRKMLDELDAARAENDLEVERYGEILSALRTCLRTVRDERDALAAELARERERGAAPSRVEVVTLPPTGSPPETETRSSNATEWFAARIADLRHEQDERSGGTPPSYERCLTALELKLEELEQAPRREAPDVAVEIGALALRIAEASRAPARPSEEEE